MQVRRDGWWEYLRHRDLRDLSDLIAARIGYLAGDLVAELIILCDTEVDDLDAAIREQRDQELAQLRTHAVVDAGQQLGQAPPQAQRRVHRVGTGHSEAGALGRVQALDAGPTAGG